MTLTARVDDGPRARLTVHRQAGGTYLLQSALRATGGGLETEQGTAVEVTLPVMLRFQFTDDTLTAYYWEGGEWTQHSELLLNETELQHDLEVGLVQTSEDVLAAQAKFVRTTLKANTVPPDISCTHGLLMPAAQTYRFKGHHLGEIREVRVGGTPLTITSQTDDQLEASRPPIAGAPTFGRVELDSPLGTQTLNTQAGWGGEPYRRGDVDGDGEVTREDWRAICYAVYRDQPLSCTPTGDINADGRVDQADLDQLKHYIQTGAAPPAEPFTTPGIVEGEPVCGIPAAPAVLDLTWEDGSPISGAVQSGDVLLLTGADLPSAEQTVIRFGNVPARVLPGATEEAMRLEILELPGRDGPRCLRLMVADPSGADETRFGTLYGATRDTAPELCPDFIGQKRDRHISGQADAKGVISLRLPPEWWNGQEIVVSFQVSLPPVSGVSRGSRVGRFTFVPPPNHLAQDSYVSAMEALAQAFTEALNGGKDPSCECDVQAKADIQGQSIILAPCVPPPPAPPVPTVPNLPTKLKANVPLWGGVDIYRPNLPPPPSCGTAFDPQVNPRAWAWCHFLEVVRPNPGADPWFADLPMFESYRPLSSVLPTGFFGQEGWIIKPDHQPPAMKRVMLEPGLTSRFQALGYDHPCQLAARRYYCSNFEASWMPRFKTGDRLIKTFWQTRDQLPAGANPDNYYSYRLYQGERYYLVGMHIGVARFFPVSGDEAYFYWITLWVPANAGVTQTHGGEPLEHYYNPHCTVGHGVDQPVELLGTVWRNFAMCTDAAPGEGACGNPWGPKDECLPGGVGHSCTSCHAVQGKMFFGDGDDLAVGWLPTVRMMQGLADACYEQIATGKLDYSNVDCARSNPNIPEDPFGD